MMCDIRFLKHCFLSRSGLSFSHKQSKYFIVTMVYETYSLGISSLQHQPNGYIHIFIYLYIQKLIAFYPSLIVPLLHISPTWTQKWWKKLKKKNNNTWTCFKMVEQKEKHTATKIKMNRMHHDEWILKRANKKYATATAAPTIAFPFVNLFVYYQMYLKSLILFSNSYIRFLLLESHGLNRVWVV